MKGITHRYTFRVWEFNRPEPGYIDPEHVRVQAFYQDTYLWGIRIRRRLLFKERVPNFAWIQQGCLGWCDWRSACPPDIWLLCTGKVKG
jgi:hypothetical protein